VPNQNRQEEIEMNRNFEAIKSMNREDGEKFLKQLAVTPCSVAAPKFFENREYDYILNEWCKYAFSGDYAPVAWISYWKNVEDDQPIEISPEKAHWEVYES